MSQPKLICADCGSEMNHHANKIEYDTAASPNIDPVFNGVLKEAHTCPDCGRSDLIDARV